MIDANQRPIEPGCRVRQLNVFDPGFGALMVNAGLTGTVQSVGTKRVEVQFDGRTKFDRFRSTSEPVTDKVHYRYLEVIPE